MPFIKQLTEPLVALQIAFGLYVTINVYFFGEVLCRIWLGDKGLEIWVPFFIASFLNIVLPPASVLLSTLMGQAKRNTQLTWWPTAISIINIVLTIPGTLYFGVRATILLTVLQFAMLSAAAIIWSRKDFNFRLLSGWKIWFKVLIVTIPVCFFASQFLSRLSNNQSTIFTIAAVQVLLGALLVAWLWTDIKNTRKLMQSKASAV